MSPPKERFYQCGKKKNPIPYNIYQCPSCLEQYSDLQRLRPAQDKNFEDITDEIRMSIWVCVPVTHENRKQVHWKLHARGKLWTRCNHPDCQALYLCERGKNCIHTI